MGEGPGPPRPPTPAAPDAPPASPPGLPASASQADIVAFLAAGEYKKAPWIAETEAARPQAGATSPHDSVRVWLNPELVASLQGGRDGFRNTMTMVTNPPHDRWSMAVKELYDEAAPPSRAWPP